MTHMITDAVRVTFAFPLNEKTRGGRMWCENNNNEVIISTYHIYRCI